LGPTYAGAILGSSEVKDSAIVVLADDGVTDGVGAVLVLELDDGTLSTSLEIPRFKDAIEHFD
jgi:hypothetical protein